MDLNEKIARQIFDELYWGQWDQVKPHFKQQYLDLADVLIDLVLEDSATNNDDSP